MKKIYGIIYSVVFVLILTACSKEALVENKGAEPSPEEEVKYIDVTFGAEFPVPAELQDNAKTMLDSDLSVLWCEGDKIAVNNDGWAGAKKNMDLDTFTGTVNAEDPHRATFSGKINSTAGKFIAVYPAANVKLGSLAWDIGDSPDK